MAIDYPTLIGDKDTDGSIKSWVNHSKVPSKSILTEAEAWIYQRLRVRQMIKSDTGTYENSNNGVIALDSTYAAPIYLELKDQSNDSRVWPKYKVDIAEVYNAFSYDGSGNRLTGTPSMWTTDASQIVFDRYAASGTIYDYTLLFYGSLTALGPSNTTNFLTTQYPRMLRHVCMAFAYEFQEDDARAAKYLATAMALLDEVEVDKDLEFLGADIQMQVPGGDFSYHGHPR